MRIVTLGSGTGQATLLRGLRAYDCQVTAVVGVTDNGGHSGLLRRILRMPQMGDTRQCLSALMAEQSVWGNLFRHRFESGTLRGQSVGNFILAALAEQYGGLSAAVAEVGRAARLAQRVLPVTDADIQVGAELEDGRHVVGEWQIIRRTPRGAVKRLFLTPMASAHPEVLAAIAAADVLICCAGSLLTGVIPVLLPAGVGAAIAASRARCVYVCNLMTQPGQTDGFAASQHVALLEAYLGRSLDVVVCHQGALPVALVEWYAAQGAQPVVNDLQDVTASVYCADLVEHPDAETIRAYTRPQATGMPAGLHLMRHDSAKLAALMMQLVASPSDRGSRREP